MTRRGLARHCTRGFSLMELLVATTLMAVIMAAVYVSFHSALRVWRAGDQSAAAYQDARVALSIMSREMHSIVTGTEHLIRGSRNQVEFFTAVPPMHPDDAATTRVLWVRYRLARTAGERGRVLERTEALVQGALPYWEPGMKEVESTPVRMGRRRQFDVATGLRSLEFSYLWVLDVDESEEHPVSREPLEVNENREGWGLPQGIRVRMRMEDDFSESDYTTFQTLIVFKGETTPVGKGLTGGPAGGFFQ